MGVAIYVAAFLGTRESLVGRFWGLLRWRLRMGLFVGVEGMRLLLRLLGGACLGVFDLLVVGK